MKLYMLVLNPWKKNVKSQNKQTNKQANNTTIRKNK